MGRTGYWLIALGCTCASPLRAALSFLVPSRRGHRSQWSILLALLATSALLALTHWGCRPPPEVTTPPVPERLVRVRLLQSANQVLLKASHPPHYWTSSDETRRQLNLPANVPMTLAWTSDGWRIGSATLGRGELVLEPGVVGSLAINGLTYRGLYRLVPLPGGQFDLVNHVELDDYLKSVLSRELFRDWHQETYRAQAIAARTYAMYEKNTPRPTRHFDLHADQRSQVYGGFSKETPKSQEAVTFTAGIVAAFGPPGQERIFKTYFSSCCGGVTQSAAEAFNEPSIRPLTAQQVGPLCSASPRFNWGPIVVTKEELTRRFRQWGANRGRREKDMAQVRSVEIEMRNAFGRPGRFLVTDIRGQRYSWAAEELRWAVNTEAADGTTLFSSFIDTIITDSDRIRFVGGHGHGHGVGMCQWCAQARARAGVMHEDIVLYAYPGAKLVRAY